MPALRAECAKACPKQDTLYKACVERITAKKEGDCESWFMEFLHCQDKCIAPKIFAATKE
jgi:ubiquinol-cytochrome c reductase subunit 6